MQRLTIEAEFVTPAFVGGDEPQHARLAATGVRGHLRWWFRAIAGGRTNGNLEEVRHLEQQLFGSTDHRSALRVVVAAAPPSTEDAVLSKRLSAGELADAAGIAAPNRSAALQRLTVRRNNSPAEIQTNTLAYLGYGPLSFRGEASREYFPAGSAWSLLLQWQHLDADLKALLDETLWGWVHLGAIGTRSRRGFGSFRCTSARTIPAGVNDPLQSTTVDSFVARAHEFLAANARSAVPAQWSHFTSASRIYISSKPFENWQQAMTAAGAWMIAFRRRYGIVSDERALRNRDYEWLKSRVPPAGVPDRAGFGLPLPFAKPDDLIVTWGNQGRRASPLLLRISKFADRYYPVFTHLPALLVPAGQNLRFRGRTAPITPDQESVVERFLDDLELKTRIRKV